MKDQLQPTNKNLGGCTWRMGMTTPAGWLKCDTGRVYVATKIGIQVLDQLGWVNAILPIHLQTVVKVRMCLFRRAQPGLFSQCSSSQ